MKTRNKTYADYGFQQNEEKYIRFLARQPDYERRLLLYDAAYSVEPSLADDIVYSIVGGVSYEEIQKIRYIPVCRTDFHGRCRAVLASFRDRLREYGAL